MSPRPKIMRTSTVPLSLKMFCRELLGEMQSEYDILAVSSPGKELEDLASDGIPTEAIPMARQISLGSDIVSLIRLIRLCRRYRPDIIHSITPKAGLLTMVAARLTGVPVRIHSFTGLLFPYATGLKRFILKTTDRITCACATHILPEGEGVKNDLQRGNITKKPLTVLGNGNLRGIDLCYYRRSDQVLDRSRCLRDEMGIKDDDIVFIFVGRIVRDKGIDELSIAYQRLIEKYDNVHLILVGNEEPEQDPLPIETTERLTLSPNIHRAGGWIDDVRPYYAMADALVFPSYREGFPNVVLEAGSMGLPSIVTDINGSREIIQTGINGDIIPPHDAQSLYQAMSRYVTDTAYRNELSNHSRDIIASKYDAIYVRDCLKKYYKTVYKNR